MRYTENFGLVKYDYTDKMDIEAINSNMDKLDNALGGLTLQSLTPEAYAAIPEPDPATVYFVSDGKTLEIYLGTVKLGGAAYET